MAVAVLPFALLTEYLQHGQVIRLGAGVLVLLFGLYKLIDRRHPRYLARIAPTRLAWWSFLMATAHGAGLMLVPVALGLCAAPRDSNTAAAVETMMRSEVATAVAVTIVHTRAMLVSGVAIAWLVYRYLGVQFVRRAWFNLDIAWGASLVVAGGVSVLMAMGNAMH